jgi:hypothetical protein
MPAIGCNAVRSRRARRGSTGSRFRDSPDTPIPLRPPASVDAEAQDSSLRGNGRPACSRHRLARGPQPGRRRGTPRLRRLQLEPRASDLVGGGGDDSWQSALRCPSRQWSSVGRFEQKLMDQLERDLTAVMPSWRPTSPCSPTRTWSTRSTVSPAPSTRTPSNRSTSRMRRAAHLARCRADGERTASAGGRQLRTPRPGPSAERHK